MKVSHFAKQSCSLAKIVTKKACRTLNTDCETENLCYKTLKIRRYMVNGQITQ
jgi:hypothetical protein